MKHQEVDFRCMSCEKVYLCCPDQKWCREDGCGGQLILVGQCFVCMQLRATDRQVICSHCKPILIGLRKLLETRSESDAGGDAPVDNSDMMILSQLVYSIIRAKWATDADGDLPVEPRLVDLTRFQYFSGRPLPHIHKAETITEFLNILYTAASNATQAMKDYQDVQKDVYDRFSEQLRALSDENASYSK